MGVVGVAPEVVVATVVDPPPPPQAAMTVNAAPKATVGHFETERENLRIDIIGATQMRIEESIGSAMDGGTVWVSCRRWLAWRR